MTEIFTDNVPALVVPCLVGPTGAGKTAAALALAEHQAISVINADSRQVYRDFPIITAQPSQGERERCPHLLYGFLECERVLGAGEYARLAAASIAQVSSEGRLPILVGGTGLYLRTLFEGIAPIPPISLDIHDAWQERCRQTGSPALYAELMQRDPDYAAKIHPNDRQRVTRALEVLDATGKPFSWWHGRTQRLAAYTPCTVGIAVSLDELEPVLARRIDMMLEAGALAEAQRALAESDDPTSPGWSGIGCAEVYQYLTGQLALDECRLLWLKNTRAYAKRQLTWFRADSGIRWFAPHQSEAIVDYILRAVSQ